MSKPLSQQHLTLAHVFSRAILVVIVLTSAVLNVRSQSSATDGATPAALQPGAPVGSYALSGLDNINLYNGNLNFHLPLGAVGGRGEAGTPIMLPIERKWRVIDVEVPQPGGSVNHIYTPVSTFWHILPALYNPGSVQGRRAGHEVVTCQFNTAVYAQTLTRLTFTAPDGTEFEMRDTLTNGQPGFPNCNWQNPQSRGTEFVTADGSGATFISDSTISDTATPSTQTTFTPSGYLMLPNGSKYRIDSGKVTWLRDRNGNKITYQYDTSSRVSSITDALNRVVTITYVSGPPIYQDITFKGFGGATRTIRVNFGSMSTVLHSGTLQTYHQLFPELGGSTTTLFNPTVVTSVTLPNGKDYQFRYNVYGELARVVLPTGAAYEYDHTGGGEYTSGTTCCGVADSLNIYRRVVERRVYSDGGTGSAYENKTTYSLYNTISSNGGYVVVKTYKQGDANPLGQQKHYFFGSPTSSFLNLPTDYSGWSEGKEYQTESLTANGATVLRREVHSFQQRAPLSWWPGSVVHNNPAEPPNDPRPTETVTTLEPSGQNLVSKVTFGYDDSVPFNNRNNLKEYDFGVGAPGALVRETRTTYITSSTYTGTSVHLRGLPSRVSIYNGSGVEQTRTDLEFDNYASDTNHAALVDRPNISGFDSAFNTSYLTRGNATCTTRTILVNGSGSITSCRQFDIAGNAVKTIDPRGFTVTTEFADRFGSPDGDARANSTPTELGSLTSYAFGTKVTNDLGHTAYVQFDYYIGNPVDSEDTNGIVTSGYFNDTLDRPTQIRRAVGTALQNQTTFAYDNDLRIITTTRDQAANNDNVLVTKLLYDKLGRTVENRQYEGGSNYIAVQTQYDALGRAFKVSKPFRPWLNESAVWTTQAFDAIGRLTSITNPDNAVVATSYDANAVTVTDPASRKRKSIMDALGRMKQVYEDPDGLNYLTSYSYDVLDNVTSVTQGTQTRSFAYNSLGQLTSATNPENGTTTYQHDNSGNVVVRTDARNVSAHYAYDALNRLTRRWYNGSSSTGATTHNSPALPAGVGASNETNYFYDSQSLPSGAPTFTRGSSTGRQVAVTYGTNSSAGDYFGYDALGRSVVKIQQTGGVNYQISGVYNLANNTTAITYPSGRTANYVYDSAGRTSSFSGNLGDGNSRTYSSTYVYNSASQITQELFGTATPLYHKLQYNIRGQLWDVRVSTGADVNGSWNRGCLQFFYESTLTHGASGPDNNGNVLKANHYVPLDDQSSTWAIPHQLYTYDSLNRITSVTDYFMSNTQSLTQQGVQSYTYDRWGNRTINTGATSGTGINNKAFNVNTANNRLTVPGGQSGLMEYDNAGNLTNDTYSGVGNRTYDAENKITSAWGGNNQAQAYTYDGSGQRIIRSVDGVATWQVYGLDGELLAEYPASGAAGVPKNEYGYRTGELLIVAEPGTSQSPPSSVNVAAAGNGAVATASSTYPTVTAANTINGDHVGTGSWWADDTSNAYPDWVEVQFAGSKNISQIDVFGLQQNHGSPVEPTLTMTSSYALTNFEVQYWTGSAWATVPGASVTGNDKVWRRFSFTPLTTTRIRVNVTNVAGDNRSQIVEIEAYGPLNVAASGNGAVATASSTYPTVTAANTINGDHVGTGSWWADDTSNAYPDWVEVQFAGSKNISQIDVYGLQTNHGSPVEPTLTMTSSYALTNFEVQYWTGSAWATVPGASVSGNDKVWRQFVFAPLSTTRIRVNVTNVAGDNRSQIVEIKAYAASSNASVKWLVSDHIGTPRIIVDQTGSLANVRRHDYLPFGEELFAVSGGRSTQQGYAGGDGVRQQFTSQERDLETGLDYFGARYYSSTQGRFTGSDPGKLLLADPQSFNRYSYVQNNPLKFIDPTGRDLYLHGDDATYILAELSRITGLRLQRDPVTGKVTIVPGSQRNMNGTSTWFANRLQEAIGDNRANIHINTGRNQPNVFFDRFRDQQLDVADYNEFKKADPKLAAAILGHVIEEYYYAQIIPLFTSDLDDPRAKPAGDPRGPLSHEGKYPESHESALGLEANVLSDFTGWFEQTRPNERAQDIGNGYYLARFHYSTVLYDVYIKNFAVQSIYKMEKQKPRKVR